MPHLIGVNSDIAIVGAGIGGLTLALALAQSGVSRVQLYERRTKAHELGAGIQLGPNATRILISLGLEKELEGISERFPMGELRRAKSGLRVTNLPLNEYAMRAYGVPNCQLPRDRLHKILLKALVNTLGYDPVTWGDAITNVNQSSAQPFVTTSDGSTYSFDLILAADGVNSAVRTSLFPDSAEPQYSGYFAWRGIVHREDLPNGMSLDKLCVWLDESRHLVAYPINQGNHINLVGVSESSEWSAEHSVVSALPSDWLHEYADWSEEPRQLVSALKECRKWALMTMPPRTSWSCGAIGLLGDAAHPMLPSLAQGAAQAIEDARCLADLISAQRYTAEDLLNAYFTQRIARVTRVQQVSEWNLAFFHRRQSLVTNIQDWIMRVGGRATSYGIAKRHNWLYRE